MILRNTQKWTLAYKWYARVLRAYNMQFSRAYDTKFVDMHTIRCCRVHMIRIYPTTLILPIEGSPFLRINTTSFRFLFGVLYTHFHEIGLERGGCMLLTTEALKIVPKLGHVLIASLLDVYFLCARGHALLEDKAREVPQCCEWVILRLL